MSQLLAYCDESGDSKFEKDFVMAGLIGSTREWTLFERKWQQITGSIEFHAKDFFARDENGKRCGIYKEWTNRQAEAFIRSLALAVVSSRLELVSMAVDIPAFMARTIYERRYLTASPFHLHKHYWTSSGAPSKPYAMAFSYTIITASDMRRDKSVPVHFWFDNNKSIEGWANDAFRMLRDRDIIPEEVRSGLGELTFSDSKEHPGLQAADLCAYMLAYAARSKDQRFKTKDLFLGAHAVARIGKSRIRAISMGPKQIEVMLAQVPDEIRRAWNTNKQRGFKTGRKSRTLP